MTHRITGERRYLEKYNQAGHIWTRIPESEDLKHLDRDCICDKCIEDYIALYERIEKLHDTLADWRKRINRKEKDKINDIIHKKIKVRVKKKKKKKVPRKI